MRDAYAGLNGLTDGWAGLLESLDALARAKTLSADQRREALRLGDAAYAALYRCRRPAWRRLLFVFR